MQLTTLTTNEEGEPASVLPLRSHSDQRHISRGLALAALTCHWQDATESAARGISHDG